MDIRKILGGIFTEDNRKNLLYTAALVATIIILKPKDRNNGITY